MIEDKKTWMIEAGDVLDVMTPDKKQPTTVKVNQRRPSAPAMSPRVGVAEPPKRRPKQLQPAKSSLQFAPLVSLTYLLGPLAILLTPHGRQQKHLVVLAAVSVAATLGLVVGRFGGLVSEGRPGSVWFWAALAVIAVVGGFTVWARALHLAGREGIPHVNKLPHWLRRGSVISALGLIAPGSGMLLKGRAGRASLTLWLLWPVVLALVFLANAMGLWRHHMVSGWLASSGPVLETTFLVAAVVVALGFLGYVAQALEGMRQVLVEPGLQTHVKGDYYALGVVVAVIAMIIVANPVEMAHQLDLGSDILREEGMQSIPLQLTLTASRLDPAKPEYTMQAMELYTAMNQPEQADALRADLNRDLGSYVAMVQKEAVAEFGLAQATKRHQVKPQAAEIQSTEIARTDPAVPESAATLYMGAMVRDEKPVANVPSQRPSTIRMLGLPFGLSLPLGETDSAVTRDAVPAK